MLNPPPRLLPSRPFPSYVFTPGENPHPKKEGGHMEGESDPVVPPINRQSPEKDTCLRYAIDLYHYGYYWESHVYLEALWNAEGRKGDVADFFKALIKLCAAGLKLRLEQKLSAEDHLHRALELIQQIRKSQGNSLLGFDLEQLAKNLPQGPLPPIFPDWA